MKNIMIILLALLALFVGINIGGYFYQPPYMKTINTTYTTSTEGFTEVETRINGTKVYLIGGCYAISFDVTPDQAYSIQKGIERTIGVRPLTHDIMKDILENFDISILQIKIDRYQNDIYYASITLRRGNQVLDLDARPSDSIALALRTNMLLYFKQNILEANGDYIC